MSRACSEWLSCGSASACWRAGIVYHVQFMIGLRKTRAEMKGHHLIHGDSAFPVSLTLIAAIALLAIGIAAILFLLG